MPHARILHEPCITLRRILDIPYMEQQTMPILRKHGPCGQEPVPTDGEKKKRQRRG